MEQLKIIHSLDFDPGTSLHADRLANILEASAIYATFIHDGHYMVHEHQESSAAHTPNEGISFLNRLGYDRKAKIISSLVLTK